MVQQEKQEEEGECLFGVKEDIFYLLFCLKQDKVVLAFWGHLILKQRLLFGDRYLEQQRRRNGWTTRDGERSKHVGSER